MANKQSLNKHIAATPFSSPAISLSLTLFAWTIIYEWAASAFCEYGGIQNRPEYDVKPVDMLPVVLGSIGSIRPHLTQA